MATLVRFFTFLLFFTSLCAARKPKPKPKPKGCRVGKTTYKEGQTLPVNPSRPCEVCVCKKSQIECNTLSCPAPQEGFCVKEGECCPSPPPCGEPCTTPFQNIPVVAKKGKKTYKFTCDFSMVYTNEAVVTSKSSVKCKPPKGPRGLKAKVILKGDDELQFDVIVSLSPFAITAATVKGSKCNEEPTTEEPLTKEPTTEEPLTKEPTTEKPLTKEPITEEPVTELPPGTNCEKCESIIKGQRCGQNGGPFRMNCTQCCSSSSSSRECAEWRCDAGGWLCQNECTSDPGKGDCVYNNRLYPLGKTINIVEKCSILTCKDGRLGPQWDIEILGCSCCQYNGRLLKDGDEVVLYNGQVAKCCDGQMVTAIDIPGGIGESVINLNENGQSIVQQNTFNYSTGLLTIVVPPHIAVLQQDFSESTSMFHEATDAHLLKANSSCVLSNIPFDANVYGIAQYFEKLKNGTEVWDDKNKEIVYDVKMIKSVVGPEERKSLMPAMNNLCNNEVIKKTENQRISKEKYEKLINGEIVFLGDGDKPENRQFCATETSCTSSWPNACGNTGWFNPALNRTITMHRVSATSVCLTCCLPITHLCNCSAQFPNLCPCEIITTKEIFEDCLLMEDGDGMFNLNFQDSHGTMGTQLTSYNPNNDERSVKIEVPSHGGASDLTVLMHAHRNGYWHHYATNNMMVKLGSTCHIRTLPTNIFPFDIASGIKHIEAGNFTVRPDVEMKKHSILLNDGLLPSNEANLLNSEIKAICQNDEYIKYQEVDVDDVQFEKLKEGGIVILEENNEEAIQMRSCVLQTAITSDDNEWGCWRWPNPFDGTEIMVHGVVQSVMSVTCCIDLAPPHCCDSLPFASYCRCEDIVDWATFRQCMVPAETVVDIEESAGPLISQTFAYNKTGSGHLNIDMEAHGDIEKATMVLDKSQGLQMLMTNTSCHLLPLNGRDPITIALNAAEMAKLLDGPLTSAMETISTSVLVSHPGEIPSLPDHMDICDGMDIILADEVPIDQAQYYELDSGQIITLPIGSVPSYSAATRMDKCILLTKCASNNGSSCIRWPNPGTGASIAVHDLVSTPTCLSCCVEGHDPMYCDCDQIIDMQTFQQCLYPKEMQEIVAVITGLHGQEVYGNVEVFVPYETDEGLELIGYTNGQSNYPVKTSGGVGAYINNSLIVCQGTGGVENGCLMVNAESFGTWIEPANTILTDPLTWGGASAKYKSGPNGDEPGETWWIIGGDPQGTRTQEWNSVLGANPWEPPVLPVTMNIPCMVAVNDREIFVTSTPMFEAADTNLAWIYSRDYQENDGWKDLKSLQKKRFGPACGVVPIIGMPNHWWIMVAGGYKESSTEIFMYPADTIFYTYMDGPDLGDYNPIGGAMVTLSTGDLILFIDNEDILAINNADICPGLLCSGLDCPVIACPFFFWKVVGRMNPPRHSMIALAFLRKGIIWIVNQLIV